MATSRETALRLLVLVEQKKVKADETLDDLFDKANLDQRDKSLVFELAYGVLRWQGRLDWILESISLYPLAKLTPWIRNILRLGAYQILFLTRVPSWAAISEANKLAHRFGHRGTASLVNGILRKLDREKSQTQSLGPPSDNVQALSRWYSHPEWMVQRWIARLGIKATLSILKANNQVPPLTVRVNSQKILPQEFLNLVKHRGFVAQPCRIAPEGVRLKARALDLKTLLENGLCIIQDEASMLVSYIAHPTPGMCVIDACAAPGAKSTHMAQLMKDEGTIWAIDNNLDRLKLLDENVKRLQISSIKAIHHDIRIPGALDGEADLVLLDAPCSAFGVLRRHPEVKWIKEQKDLNRLAQAQGEIMGKVSQYVKPGGRLVYSVCSFELEETQEVVENFLESHPEFSVINPGSYLPEEAKYFLTSRGFFKVLPGQEDMDGFFVVCLLRNY